VEIITLMLKALSQLFGSDAIQNISLHTLSEGLHGGASPQI